MEVHHTLTGARALDAIARLHGDSDLMVTDAWIAHYGEESPSAMLYVGAGESRDAARALLDSMVSRIGEGGTPFQPAHTVRMLGRDVLVMSGQGQIHFVFSEGSRVVWLSADPAVACRALGEVLGAEPGKEEEVCRGGRASGR
jgi:hypothetical protein